MPSRIQRSTRALRVLAGVWIASLLLAVSGVSAAGAASGVSPIVTSTSPSTPTTSTPSGSGVAGGNAFSELAQKAQEQTTSTESTATTATSTSTTEGETRNSTKTIFIAIGAALVLLVGIAYVIVRDARRVAPAGDVEELEARAARDLALRQRNRRAKSKAARAQRKKNR